MRYRSLPDSENVVDRRDRAGLLGTAEGLLSPVDAVMSAPHVINQQYIQPWLHGGKYSNYDADIDASIERDSAPPSQQNQVLMPPSGPADSRWAKGGSIKHRGSSMPLHHGTSRAVFSRNVSEMMHAGHPQDQALAAAYRMKRQQRADGGDVVYSDPTEAPLMDPENLVLPHGVPNPDSLFAGPVSSWRQPGGGEVKPIPNAPNVTGLAQQLPPSQHGKYQYGTDRLPEEYRPRTLDIPLDALDQMASGGPVNKALVTAYRVKRDQGGVAPWIVRNEARSMSRPMRSASPMAHTGPVSSIVPGRTDRHNVHVSSGSYVLPADHVSSLGQGNTQAGYAILNRMFSAGPYGSKLGGIKHGSGPPHAPSVRMQKPFGSDQGGGRGDESGSPTPVVIAGGEYVIPPHVVEAIGAGIAAEEGGTPLQRGHEALDEWVVQHRKKHVKTLRKLPPPAKR